MTPIGPGRFGIGPTKSSCTPALWRRSAETLDVISIDLVIQLC
jgi:hypothetical protein